MSNIIQTTTDFAMFIVSGYISPGDVLVDATCGNGHDTLRLLRHGPSALYAFDIQQQAVDNTKELLISNGFRDRLEDGTVKLICDSHENMDLYISTPVKAVVFNLGYLPGAARDTVTERSSTLAAAAKALELLQKDGLLCITMYSGHSKGPEEKEALLSMARGLNSRTYHAAYVNIANQKNDPPEILLITKKR